VAFGKLVRLANRDVTTSNNSYKLAPVQDRTVTKVRSELALRSQGRARTPAVPRRAGGSRSQGGPEARGPRGGPEARGPRGGPEARGPRGRIESNKRNTLYWAQYNLKQMGYNKFR
jgi:hypothetical protein